MGFFTAFVGSIPSLVGMGVSAAESSRTARHARRDIREAKAETTAEKTKATGLLAQAETTKKDKAKKISAKAIGASTRGRVRGGLLGGTYRPDDEYVSSFGGR